MKWKKPTAEVSLLWQPQEMVSSPVLVVSSSAAQWVLWRSVRQGTVWTGGVCCIWVLFMHPSVLSHRTLKCPCSGSPGDALSTILDREPLQIPAEELCGRPLCCAPCERHQQPVEQAVITVERHLFELDPSTPRTLYFENSEPVICCHFSWPRAPSPRLL